MIPISYRYYSVVRSVREVNNRRKAFQSPGFMKINRRSRTATFIRCLYTGNDLAATEKPDAIDTQFPYLRKFLDAASKTTLIRTVYVGYRD